MPVSDPHNQRPTLDYIRNKIESDDLKSLEILDLGIGVGNFGRIIKEFVTIPTKITGVDIYDGYRNEQWDYYDSIIVGEIRDFLKQNKKKYDVVLLIDVLEHFDKDVGKEVLESIIKQADKALILSTPITRYPQGPYDGNAYEEHKAVWSNKEILNMGFKKLYSRWMRTYAFWPPISKLGVYVFEK